MTTYDVTREALIERSFKLLVYSEHSGLRFEWLPGTHVCVRQLAPNKIQEVTEQPRSANEQTDKNLI